MRTSLFLFAALSDGDIGWMARAGEVRRFAPGEPLISQGEQPSGLLVVLSGAVRVETESGSVVAVRRAGECVGEVSLVDTRPASSNVVAAEPTSALLLTNHALRARLDTDPGFAARCYRGLAILLANRLREATSGSDTDEALTLDDTMLDGMARAGERFHLLTEYADARAP